MKNIFGVKYEKKQPQSSTDGACFVVRQIDESQNQNIKAFDDKIKQINSKAKLPLWLTISSHALLFISIVLIISILTVLQEEGVSLSAAFTKAPWMFIILPISFLGWVATKIYKRFLSQKVKNSGEVANLKDEAEQIIKQSKSQLAIPSDAHKVDTFHFFYQDKNGRDVIKSVGGANYFNVEMFLYKDQQNFYLADLALAYCFPLASITSLVRIRKTVSFDIWNKKEAITAANYQSYKIKANSFGALFINEYLVLTLKVNQDNYSILFPIYEQEVIEKVLEIKAEPLEKQTLK